MMNEEIRAREERLRAILRQGDPAGGEAGLAQEEVRRVRRAVLAALPPFGEPRRRAFWMPAVAMTAAAALTLAIALGLWRAHTDPAGPARETGRQAVRVHVPPGPAPVLREAPEEGSPAPVAPSRESALPKAEAPRRPRSRGAVTPAAPPAAPPSLESARLASASEEGPEVPAVEPDSTLLPEEPAMRQVQFAAPGGTRVLWMLSTESVVDEFAE